jgi:hypothetical protein
MIVAPVVSATVQVYNSIREQMLPTPAKSHYTFNLRDLARVIQVPISIAYKHASHF